MSANIKPMIDDAAQAIDCSAAKVKLMNDIPERSGLELRSKITSEGELQLWLADVPIPALAESEVLIRIEAAPINPSDLGLLLGPVDPSTLRAGGTAARPTITGNVPQSRLAGVAGRLDEAMPVGNEGAGVVVAAGGSAPELVGRTVAACVPGMYAQYRVVAKSECMVLPVGTTARDGASAFVNPLTVVSMIETMRREGHTALVHTAAASNLGQMLNRVCLADGIPLVNIVRNAEQARILREVGAKSVLDSTSSGFADDLTEAVAETGATLAFDAIGGGSLAATILASMEKAALRTPAPYSRYGSPIHKQVYIYGGLDMAPTELARNFGMSWSIGGWLVFRFMEKIGVRDAQRLRDRVGAELTTTFASRYTADISLAQVLSPDIIAAYGKRATGEKYLITPNEGGD